MDDINAENPFTFSSIFEKFCGEVHCGTFSDDVVSNFFPIVIVGLFFIPLFVVFVNMLLEGKTKESVLLQRSVSTNNVLMLLFMSLVIAGLMIGLFWYM